MLFVFILCKNYLDFLWEKGTNFFLSFLHLLTCVYIIWASFPLPTSRQFSLLVLQFCWWKNIKDNKKNRAFLLVWDKDSCAGWFPALIPGTCVLESTLVHLRQSSSLPPSPLPIVASASLRLLHSLLYSEHINHIQVFGFLPFPIPLLSFPLVCDPCPIILLHLF
jgi:hypothetical protein